MIYVGDGIIDFDLILNIKNNKKISNSLEKKVNTLFDIEKKNNEKLQNNQILYFDKIITQKNEIIIDCFIGGFKYVHIINRKCFTAVRLKFSCK